MNKCILGVGLLLLVGRLSVETEFIKTLPAEEFAAAGLSKLTPAELVRLEAAVLHFKAGEVAVVKQEAEAKVAAAEAKAKQTEAATAGEKKSPSWFMALLTLKQASEKPGGAESLESTLVGDYRGYSGNTVFTLTDGSQWVQQNRTDTSVYSPTQYSSKVKIYPATFAGFWLEVAGVPGRVRVVLFEAKERK